MNISLTRLSSLDPIRLSLYLLLIFHLIGVIGIASTWQDYFLPVTPINLLLAATILFLNHSQRNLRFWMFCTISFSIGFLFEYLGVQTGAIFGEYAYGEVLGWKLGGVSVIIGVIWAVLTYCTGVISNALPFHNIVKAIVGASLMVGLDFLIEPIAIKLEFWNWAIGYPPVQNYIGWFLIAFGLVYLFHRMKIHTDNAIAWGLFAIQVAFFGILNLIL